MKCIAAAALICLSLSSYADSDISKVNGAIRVSAGESVRDVSTVNGSVHIEDDVKARNVETVNGSIQIGARSKVETVGTVNGSIVLGENARARSMESVNGKINLHADAEVAGDVSTSNGAVSMDRGATVQGTLANVNGSVTMTGAQLGGGIEMVNGNLTIGPDSHVRGGVLIKKRGFSWFNRNSRVPKVVIGPHAIVEGRLEFQREVALYVSDTATIGEVKGATPIRFSGSKP